MNAVYQLQPMIFKQLLKLLLSVLIIVDDISIIYHPLGATLAHDVKGSQYCEFFNETLCSGEFKEECVEKEECAPHDPDKRNHCYVLWQYDSITQKSTIKLKVRDLSKL